MLKKKISAKLTNPKDRLATSRLDLTLFPQTAIAYGALAMTEGDLKYGGYNCRLAGVSVNVYVAALLRHVFKWYNGETADVTTCVPHLASAIACLGVLIDAIECNKLNDDRPPKADITKLLDKFELSVKHLQSIFPNPAERFVAIPPKSLSHDGVSRTKTRRSGGKSKKRQISHASQIAHERT